MQIFLPVVSRFQIYSARYLVEKINLVNIDICAFPSEKIVALVNYAYRIREVDEAATRRTVVESRDLPEANRITLLYATTPIIHRDVAQSRLLCDPKINPRPRHFIITQRRQRALLL